MRYSDNIKNKVKLANLTSDENEDNVLWFVKNEKNNTNSIVSEGYDKNRGISVVFIYSNAPDEKWFNGLDLDFISQICVGFMKENPGKVRRARNNEGTIFVHSADWTTVMEWADKTLKNMKNSNQNTDDNA